MGQLTELEPLRKKRKLKKQLRRIIILSIFFTVLIVSAILWNELKKIDVKTKFMDFASSIGTGQGYPLNTQASAIKKLIPVGNQIGALDDTNFYIYNQSGKQGANIQHGYNNAVVKSQGGRILIYDRGGNKLRVDSKSRNLLSKNYEHNIIYADISVNGNVAVATGSNEYARQVMVYNNKFEEIFKWSSSEGLIVNIALSPNKDMMCVGLIDAVDGALTSTIAIFKFNTEESAEKLQMPEETILSVEFKDNGKIYVVTDKSVYKISSNGKIETRLDFEGTSLYAFENNQNKDIAVVLGDYREERNLTLYSLDYNLDVTEQMMFYEEIKAIELDNLGIAVTLNDRIELYDFMLKKTDEVLVNNAKTALPIEKNLYYTISNELDKKAVTRPPRNKTSMTSSSEIDEMSEVSQSSSEENLDTVKGETK